MRVSFSVGDKKLPEHHIPKMAQYLMMSFVLVPMPLGALATSKYKL